LTGGNYRVWGPAESFIEDNNHLGAALIMVIPLMRYLQLQAQRRYVRYGLLAAMALTGLAVLGTQSRGAAVAGAAMLFFLLMRSRQKVLLSIGLVVGLAVGLTFMPQEYWDRINTIGEYEEDESATGRLDTWEFAWRYALDHPIVGGGFNMFDSIETRQRYTPGQVTRASHSIWFETLGEHGFVGLFIFVAIGATALASCGRLRRLTRRDPERTWIFDLASNLQVSLLGFAVAGTFLNKAFYDMYWQLLAVIVSLAVIVRNEFRGAAFDARWNRVEETPAEHEKPDATLPVYGRQ
jgi:probable O-glycosylation ligase (exosortase A-associated)